METLGARFSGGYAATRGAGGKRMSKSKAHSIEPDEKTIDARLVVDSDVQLPAPLDRRIAAVSVWTRTNNPSDGFDLSLSASFGSERIEIKSDDFEMDVELQVKSATVELNFVNCTPHPLEVDAVRYSEQWSTASTERSSKSSREGMSGSVQAEVSGAASKGASAKGSLFSKWSKEGAAEFASNTEIKRKQQDWHLLGIDAVKVGRTGLPLDGPIIADLTAWRVKPKGPSSSCAVLARVKVREDWVEFENPRFSSLRGRLRSKLNDLLLPDAKLKRTQFLALIRHLVQVQLQSASEQSEATIAIAGLVLRPESEVADSMLQGQGRRSIVLPGQPIERFLMAEEGYEAAALVGLGVKPRLIPTDTGHEIKSSKRIFVPQSSPENAIQVLRFLQQNGSTSSEKLPRNELRDLGALGLIARTAKNVDIKHKGAANPEALLRRAASLAPSMRAARTVLASNQNATTSEIAVAVALAVGKSWDKKATLQRHGMHVRRWAIWLEPQLIDPTLGSNAAALLAKAITPHSRKKGRSSIFTGEAKTRLKDMIVNGVDTKEIAEHFGVSKQTIRIWRRRFDEEDKLLDY